MKEFNPNVMRNLLLLFAILLNALSLSAQTPKSVLDDVAANYKKLGDVEIGFSVNEISAGIIRLSGEKFNIEFDDMTMWFNGKTLWTYVKSNMEVNVTNPTPAEIAKINPYAFVSLYKSGYSAEFGKSAVGEYSIVLKATDSNKSFKQIDLTISKADKKLKTVELTTRNSSNLFIRVNSYRYKKFADAMFMFDQMQHPDVDIVDLR